MHLFKLRSYLQYTLRYWLVIVIVLLFAFALVAKPTAWAATVPDSGNQTIPPGGTVPPVDHYLPIIRLRD